VYDGIVPGRRYRVAWEASWSDLTVPLDVLVGHVYWGEIAAAGYVPGTAMIWDYVCAEFDTAAARFSAALVAPEGAAAVTVRCTLRWTARGEVLWSEPVVTDLGIYQARPPARVAVATGAEHAAHRERTSLQAGVDYYADLAEKACRDGEATLVALPEIGLQWQMPDHAYETAVEVPGPETDRFAQIARRYRAVLVIGLLERAGDAVFNSAVVMDGDGSIAGVYHKVHLASTEAMSGILPGDGFPVMDTAAGRIGCTICMDSSAAESARMVGLGGADFLVLPIMGDHRASRWNPGPPRLDEDRWLCIQRTRAMDNQVCMVVARNMGRGSCIIDRSGAVLAYSDGTEDLVVADVPRDDGYRKWNGGCFRQVNWRQRRPQLYGAFTEEEPEALRRLHVEPL
jgi:N-carbamoylputrescine amidase